MEWLADDLPGPGLQEPPRRVSGHFGDLEVVNIDGWVSLMHRFEEPSAAELRRPCFTKKRIFLLRIPRGSHMLRSSIRSVSLAQHHGQE